MGIVIQQDAAALNAAFRFQTNAEFQNVKLVECSAETSAEGSGVSDEISIGLKMETKVLNAGDGAARFVVKITAEGMLKQAAQDASSVFHISCAHELLYRLNPKYVPKEDEVAAFREGNALFQCWPYSREMIHNLAMRMDVFISPLPFLRIVPKSPEPEREARPVRKKSKKLASG
jgi:hypothetical protein